MYIIFYNMYFYRMKKKLLGLSFIAICLLSSPSYSEENDSGLKFYTGMFDFSDEGQRSQLFGIQHQNSNLYRNTPLGEINNYKKQNMLNGFDDIDYLINIKSEIEDFAKKSII